MEEIKQIREEVMVIRQELKMAQNFGTETSRLYVSNALSALDRLEELTNKQEK
jgi:hypothetical protein